MNRVLAGIFRESPSRDAGLFPGQAGAARHAGTAPTFLRRAVWLVVFFLPAAVQAGEDLTNRLAGHPSPYLALHGSDPVAWQEWNADTLARARRENKLLFVSVGYFACHWCHVMQRESYKNPQIAARLNRDFIPVKVDREVNNGLDDALQMFSARLNGTAGWPLNAFVTPDGYPALAVLYAPPADFGVLLERLAARWQGDAAGIVRLARAAAPRPGPRPVSRALTQARGMRAGEEFLRGVWREADMLHGGFGEVNKFPMAPLLAALLEWQARRPEAKLDEFLRLTFDRMAARGLRDHIGGGFFRYTVDPGWDTPHFEKMLADNAHLAMLYLRAAEVLREPRYRTVALGTLEFMRDTLTGPEGGLYASTSAVDDEGREGATYLWEPEVLQRVLAPEAYAAARRVWRLDAARVFEAGYLPAEYQPPSAAERRLLDAAAKTLLPLRRARSLPLDDKRNAGLNGLALSAFSRAAAISPESRRAADRVQAFLLKRMLRGDGLVKAAARGQRLPEAELEDYAYVVQGLLDHARATGDPSSRARAIRLADTAWRRFWSERGWLREARPLLANVAPEAALADGSYFSPSAVLIRASIESNDPGLVRRARTALAWQVPEMEADPVAYPTRTMLLAGQSGTGGGRQAPQKKR